MLGDEYPNWSPWNYIAKPSTNASSCPAAGGYMWEYPICRAYADAQVVKNVGVSVEVMKTIIATEMFKGCLASRSNRD
jgi:alkylation response protein AidB-like acyl-CoA dehydrogenase